MRRSSLVVVVSLLVLSLASVAFIYSFLNKTSTTTSGTKKAANLSNIKHSSHMYDFSFIDEAFEKGKSLKKLATAHVVGGIIPHHLLASPLIAAFFEGIAKQKVSTIILMSPNHYNAGKYNVSTSKAYWTTIYGNLQPDLEMIKKLEDAKVASASEDLFEYEHGIYGITSFIKKTFPNARIVPLVFKSSVTKKESDFLVKTLQNVVTDNTLVVASVDFSHYRPSYEADMYDKESIAAIESFNLDTIFSLDGERNFDSPQAIYALVKLMQNRKANNSIFLQNTNSAKLTGDLSIQSTTSYLTMYFTAKSPLSLNTLFEYSDPNKITNDKEQKDIYTIIATGDIMPARSVNSKMIKLDDFTYPFKKTVDFLHTADAVFINLESPLILNCKSTLEGMFFCGDKRAVEGLTYAGVTVANLANNHAGNYGINGIKETSNLLLQNNIQVTGNGNPSIVAIKDKKFGFLGYNDIGVKESGIAWADEKQIEQDILSLKKQVDFIIVTFHWGVEYTSNPTQRQIELAHKAIDAGADLIIENHPHWVQGVEQYKDKFITYSHGNFVFDQMWSQETREGVLGRYTFNKTGLVNVQFIPIIIEDYSQPRFATKIESQRILTRMKEATQKNLLK